MQIKSDKPVRYIDYLNYKADLNHIPLSGVFELTSRCNFNCKMCYIHTSDCNKNEPFELSTEQWINIAKKAKDAGTVFLLLTGGEPFLRKDFGVIYKTLCELGFAVQINSNGSLISEEIFELFEEFPPTRINISLYADSNENYCNLCGVKAFDRVIANIKRLKEMNITVFINCSISNYNCEYIENISHIADDLDVRMKFATYMYPPLKKRNDFDCVRMTPEKCVEAKLKIDKVVLSDEDYYGKLSAIAKLIENSDNGCIDNSSDDNTGKIRCKAGKTAYWIDWKGNMSICGMITENNSVIDNDFKDCWDYVRKFSNSIRLPKKCNNCKYRNICNVCAANCYAETGDFGTAGDYICKTSELYAKKAKEIIDDKSL